MNEFPASYLVEDVDPSKGDLILYVDGGVVRRAVAVTPLGGQPAWSAALSVPRPLLNSACSGNYASPRPDVVLLAASGTVFWVEVGNPDGYQVLRTDGPVVEVLPVAAEGLMLLVTPWSITAVTRSGVAWSTVRIAIEGLRIDEVSEGRVRGVADPRDEEPRGFEVDLATGRVVGGAGPS